MVPRFIKLTMTPAWLPRPHHFPGMLAALALAAAAFAWRVAEVAHGRGVGCGARDRHRRGARKHLPGGCSPLKRRNKRSPHRARHSLHEQVASAACHHSHGAQDPDRTLQQSTCLGRRARVALLPSRGFLHRSRSQQTAWSLPGHGRSSEHWDHGRWCFRDQRAVAHHRCIRTRPRISITAVFVFCVAALLLFHPVATTPSGPAYGGLWAGLAVNDLSGSVAVGEFGSDAGVIVIAVKSVRIVLLGPLLVGFSLLRNRGRFGSNRNLRVEQTCPCSSSATSPCLAFGCSVTASGLRNGLDHVCRYQSHHRQMLISWSAPGSVFKSNPRDHRCGLAFRLGGAPHLARPACHSPSCTPLP